MIIFVTLHKKLKMNQGSPKFSAIVNKARELFWKHGITRVTVEEICKEANVSKMTFYRFFSNKTELGRTIIDNIMDESVEKYRSLMNEETFPLKKKSGNSCF